jgi:hypothetical protein
MDLYLDQNFTPSFPEICFSYPHIYTWVFQVVSSFGIFQSKLFTDCTLLDLITVAIVGEKYNYGAPHYVILSVPFLISRSGMAQSVWRQGFGLDGLGYRGSIPGGARNFYLCHCVQTGSGAHPASYPMDMGGSFPAEKAARA